MGCSSSTPKPLLAPVSSGHRESPNFLKAFPPPDLREDSLHSNITENGSAIQRAKSWVKDDMGFKAHLAKVNDMCELSNKFEMGDILGEGITGQVRLCRSKIDNGIYAMKSLNVSRMDEAQIAELKAEIDTLKRLDHPNIINLMEVFESDDNICIIMEHCSGGDLSQRRFETENDVASVVFQLAEAVAHCHYLGIVHRDLKMENIMFVSKDSDSIRLIDFGLSKKFLSKEDIIANDKLLAQKDKFRVMKTACGTAFYMAPEMLTMSYSEKADIWALGVITFMLITGRPPFEGRDENTVFERVRRGHVTYTEKIWQKLSPDAVMFVKALLTYDPDKRPSARETLELPWLSNYQKGRRAYLEGSDGKLLGKEVCESLMRFASYPPLKRAGLMVISHHLKETDTRELRNMFLTLDEDHSGELTFEEMYGLIQKFSGSPVTEEFFRTIFDQMDHENSGRVHYMEFLAATLESRVQISGQLLNQAFDHLDVESSGIISVENMHDLLGRNFSRDEVVNLLKKGLPRNQECESDNAYVTRADFIKMMGDAPLPSPTSTPAPPTPSDSPSSLSRSSSSEREDVPVLIATVPMPAPSKPRAFTLPIVTEEPIESESSSLSGLAPTTPGPRSNGAEISESTLEEQAITSNAH